MCAIELVNTVSLCRICGVRGIRDEERPYAFAVYVEWFMKVDGLSGAVEFGSCNTATVEISDDISWRKFLNQSEQVEKI